MRINLAVFLFLSFSSFSSSSLSLLTWPGSEINTKTVGRHIKSDQENNERHLWGCATLSDSFTGRFRMWASSLRSAEVGCHDQDPVTHQCLVLMPTERKQPYSLCLSEGTPLWNHPWLWSGGRARGGTNIFDLKSSVLPSWRSGWPRDAVSPAQRNISESLA